MYKIMDESIMFFSRVFSQNSLQKLSTFCGYKDIYSRVEMGCEKPVFSKTGCIGNSLRNWDESRVPVANYQIGQTVLFVLQ